MISRLIALLNQSMEAEKFAALLLNSNEAYAAHLKMPVGSTEARHAFDTYSKTVEALAQYIHGFKRQAYAAELQVLKLRSELALLRAQEIADKKAVTAQQSTDKVVDSAQAISPTWTTTHIKTSAPAIEKSSPQVPANDKQALRDLFNADMPGFLKELLDDPDTKVFRF